MRRQRADVVLTERGVFSSRQRARAAIMAGEVRIGGKPVLKAGEMVEPEAKVEVVDSLRYVSRGGHKLAAALEVFGLSVAGMRAVDVGASTGGFTDCLLQDGAAEVVAIDVGYGQLAWEIRQDDRVLVFERTNIREVVPEVVGAPFDLAAVDVSFIGLSKVLPHVCRLLGEKGQLLALVKPQFEAGKSRVGKKGVVRDPQAHVQVLRGVAKVAEEQGLIVRGMTWSPLTGPAGNIEFWLWAAREGTRMQPDPEEIVLQAHAELGE